MSQYIYIGSYLKSSSVQHSIIFKPTPSTRLLVIAKGTILEFLTLSIDHLEHFKEHNFYSFIHQLEVVKAQTTESLLVLTHQHQLIQVTLLENEIKLNSINLKIQSQVGRDNMRFKMKLNSSNNLLCLIDYQNLFRIIKIKEGRKLDNQNEIHNHEPLIIKDIEFIQGKEKVALFGLCKTQNLSKLQIYSSSGQLEKIHSFESSPGLLLQPPSGTVLIVITSTSYCEFDTLEGNIKNEEIEEFGEIVSKCEVDPTRWIICNSLGKFFLVVFGPIVEIKRLGVSISASSIVHLDNSLFFLAGFENLSRVIELKSNDLGFEVEEKSRFKGVNTIYDLQLINTNDIGIYNFVLGSGHMLGGTLTYNFKSVMVNVLSEIEINNVDGLWNVRLGTWDRFFVISILGSSKVLAAQGDELSLVRFHDFKQEESSLEVFSYESSIFQITASGVYKFDEDGCLIYSMLPSEYSKEKIIFASGYSNTLAIAFNDCSLFCFEITKNSILKIWAKSFTHEISCIKSHENFVAVSFWESNSMEIFEKYSGNLKLSESFPVHATAKSMSFIVFFDNVFIFVGLRNGILLYINLSTLEKQRLNLGSHNVVIQEIQFKGKAFAIAASDITIILYEHRGKIVHSSFNINAARYISSYHTESIPDSMIIAFKDRISVINHENLAKHSIEELSLQMSVVRVFVMDENFFIVCQEMSKKFVLKVINASLEEISSLSLPELIHVVDCEIIGNLIYVGCTYLDPIKAQDSGSTIRVFKVDPDKLIQINELTSHKLITCIKKFGESLLLAGSSLDLYHINQNQLTIIDSLPCNGLVKSIDVYEDFIATTCQKQFLEISTVSSNKILRLYRYNKMDNGKSLKFLNKHTVIISDEDHNISIIDINGQLIQQVSGFNLETGFASIFVRFHIPENIFSFQTEAIAFSAKTAGIFMVIPLPKENYDVLKCVQKIIEKKIQSFDGYFEGIISLRRRGRPVKGVNDFIYGDLLEEFEKIKLEEQKSISERVSKHLGRRLTESDIIAAIHDVKRIH